jgi:DNA-binding NarL/FixJ family response regulator
MGGRSRVLLVDDHAMLREAIRVALELADHEVVGETGNGSEAIAFVEELQPDVVVMDEEALRLVADGYSTHEVASRLLVSDRTVRNDLSSACEKLDARSTEAAFDGVR